MRVVQEGGTPPESYFASTFTVGTDPGCELRLADARVAPRHLQVLFDGIMWWVRDLGGPGTWVNGQRIQFVPLPEEARLGLGEGGPQLAIAVRPSARPVRAEEGLPPPEAAPPANASTSAAGPFRSETQVIARYLEPAGGAAAGRETLMIRRAFARVQRRSSRRYRLVIAAAVLALAAAGGVIAWQAHRLRALRGTAEGLFYAMKALEVQTAKVEDLVLLRADPAQVAELRERRARLRSMEGEYDAFVRELGTYGKVAEDERAILRVARAFGECEVNVPRGFVAEVRRYVERWRSTDRLARALERASQRGYGGRIAGAFAASGLPSQYVFLAAQESGFDDRAVGPATRFGHAKGMWQFIPATARRYGLRVGPLHDRPVYDAQDERFDWEKATGAAVRYVRDLHATDAQASGLLAMACYNWGEGRIRAIVAALPEDPRERNFWRLLGSRQVPRETYDYVLSIFSAAVICEDPKLFGFELRCPALDAAPAAAVK